MIRGIAARRSSRRGQRQNFTSTEANRGTQRPIGILRHHSWFGIAKIRLAERAAAGMMRTEILHGAAKADAGQWAIE